MSTHRNKSFGLALFRHLHSMAAKYSTLFNDITPYCVCIKTYLDLSRTLLFTAVSRDTRPPRTKKLRAILQQLFLTFRRGHYKFNIRNRLHRDFKFLASNIINNLARSQTLPMPVRRLGGCYIRILCIWGRLFKAGIA